MFLHNIQNLNTKATLKNVNALDDKISKQMAFKKKKKDHKHTFQDNISQKWVRFLKITQKTDIMFITKKQMLLSVMFCYLMQ